MSYGKERRAHPEFAPELTQGFIRAFFNRYDSYAVQSVKGSYYRITQPLTAHLVSAHVKGLLTLGTYALDRRSQARWLCFDADEEEQWEGLKDLTRKLQTEGIVPYLERSHRGGHLWLFTSPLPSKNIRQFGNGLLEKYNVPSMEMYPKQDELQGGLGSLVRLPLGIHRKTGQRYPFITPEGKLLAPTLQEQLELLSSPLLVPSEFITSISLEIEKPSLPTLPIAKPSNTTTLSGEYLSQRLKHVISVYDFVRHYVQLDEQGKGLCPFHKDHIESFQVNIRENYWHCYAGCGGGSLIDFWMKWREMRGQDNRFTPTITDLAALLLSE